MKWSKRNVPSVKTAFETAFSWNVMSNALFYCKNRCGRDCSLFLLLQALVYNRFYIILPSYHHPITILSSSYYHHPVIIILSPGSSAIGVPVPRVFQKYTTCMVYSEFWFSVSLLSCICLCLTVFVCVTPGSSALCGYPIVKMEIRDSSQISTTAPIFLLSNYFRQKYLKIASYAVSLLNNIWVRVEHSLLQQPNLKENQLQFKQFAGMMCSWTLDSDKHTKYL